jgi:hypothetical protein
MRSSSVQLKAVYRGIECIKESECECGGGASFAVRPRAEPGDELNGTRPRALPEDALSPRLRRMFSFVVSQSSVRYYQSVHTSSIPG